MSKSEASPLPGARHLNDITMENSGHWRFYLLVVSGFQSAGSLNFLENAKGVARCPAAPQMERVNDDVSKESLVWPRPCDGHRHVGFCFSGCKT